MSHFLVDAVGFPDFPTDFEVGKEGRIIEGEKIVSLDMTVGKAVLRVVDSCFS